MSNRIAYYTNESFYDREMGMYFIAKVTENEAGYERSSLGLFAGVDAARIEADRLNDNMGHTRDDVLDIVASSMRQGSVR